jgi:Ser-tRNA(Ala) deacylase AlaX
VYLEPEVLLKRQQKMSPCFMVHCKKTKYFNEFNVLKETKKEV